MTREEACAASVLTLLTLRRRILPRVGGSSNLGFCVPACPPSNRLSVAIGAEGGSVPYGDLFEELLGGMFDLHWEQEEEAFFDRGLHVPDGRLVEEVIMRCRNGASVSRLPR